MNIFRSLEHLCLLSKEWSANLAAMASYEEEGADVDWGGRGWCWDGFDRSFLALFVSHTPLFFALFGPWAQEMGTQIFPRCRFVGEKDSQDHARGEGSLTYTNGNCFKVKNATMILRSKNIWPAPLCLTGRKLVVVGEV